MEEWPRHISGPHRIASQISPKKESNQQSKSSVFRVDAPSSQWRPRDGLRGTGTPSFPLPTSTSTGWIHGIHSKHSIPIQMAIDAALPRSDAAAPG